MKKLIAVILTLILLCPVLSHAQSTVDMEDVNGMAATILNDLKHQLLDRNSMDIRDVFVWVDDSEWLYVFTYVAKNQMGGLSESEIAAVYHTDTEEYTIYNVKTGDGDLDVAAKFNTELVPQLADEVAKGNVMKLSLSDVKEIMRINQALRETFGDW